MVLDQLLEQPAGRGERLDALAAPLSVDVSEAHLVERMRQPPPIIRDRRMARASDSRSSRAAGRP